MHAKKERGRYLEKEWVHKILAERKEKSEFYLLVKDLQLFDCKYFFKSFSYESRPFELLLLCVTPYIKKSSLRRKVASPAETLCVTLRHLCTGDAHITIATSYCISPLAFIRIIRDTNKAIWNVLQARNFLSVPSTQDAWLRIASDFERKWNFPHCLGAIDGKHVIIQAPGRSGSNHFNYKKVIVFSGEVRGPDCPARQD